MKILIIGGSIAGMACALSLQKRGHRVSILERRSSAASGGFGMILDTTACQNLQELNVSMAGHTHSIGQYHVHDLNHNFHSRKPLQGCQGIERQRLVSQMRNQLQPGTIHFGSEFDHFIVDKNGSTRAAALKNGRIIEADLFIGADGVRSKIRHDCFPESTLSSVKSVIESLGYSFYGLIIFALDFELIVVFVVGMARCSWLTELGRQCLTFP